MSRVGILAICIVLVACSRESVGTENPSTPSQQSEYAVSHGMIVLGDRLENPYTTENMQEAYISVYPTKSRNDVKTSHLYVRFLPANEEEYDLLMDQELDMVDYPVDYEILVDGDYYHDPSIDEDEITWQYAVVPEDYVFPDIKYEIIDECCITESDPITRGTDDGIDWEAVEMEAFRLTGNEDMLCPQTKGSKVCPSGRITIVDDEAYGGKPVGVAGVRVRCNTFVKFSRAFTDRDGYYTIPKKFSANLKYRLVFKNEKGFAIGFNLILQPASASALGKGPATGLSATITKDSDRKLFLRSAVNNSAYEYLSRCSADDMNLTMPPGDIRIWLLEDVGASSAVMIHHDVVVSHSMMAGYLGFYGSLISYFAPDITIGTLNMHKFSDVYRAVCHEFAHASHFTQVGKEYWNKYVEYILRSYLLNGGSTYGDGSGELAGYCEIGEMWAYFMESVMYQERYGGQMPQFGTTYWFSPQIFRYLYERGLSRSDFLDAMHLETVSIEILQSKLLSKFPEKAEMIAQVFTRYK